MVADDSPRPVLVIVFDALQRDLIALTLKRGSYRPLLCADLASVRQQIDTEQPAALVVDLYLPGCNGLDLVKELASEGRLAKCPVLAVSAFGFPEVIRQAVLAGCQDFLVKPVSPDLLIMRMKQLLAREYSLRSL